MSYARHGLSFVTAVVGPGTLLLAGMAITLVLSHGAPPTPDEPTRPAQSGRVSVSDDGRSARARIGIAAGEASTLLVLEGPAGEELASFVLFRTGAFTLEPVEPGPLRFVVNRGTDRSVRVGVSNVARVGFRLDALSDGSAEFRVEDPERNPVHLLRVRPEGRMATDGAP